MSQRIAHEAIERAVNEQGRKLADDVHDENMFIPGNRVNHEWLMESRRQLEAGLCEEHELIETGGLEVMKLEDFRFRLGRDGEWGDVLTFDDLGAYEGEDNGIFPDCFVAGKGKVSGNSGCTRDGLVPGWEIEVVE